ncbi:Transporter, MFS superfamily [Granulibacter bethesdensis]|uniref:Transporter, MFS superfamily n=1 Tax=Granulibacter bethesdensis TaxID=364410 RepID=A0AAC9K7A1_9PROT|nr:MFS transporter [Granulibacter bethesdensis]APH54631.1 Transporter, MFS superfamily [Granulibacter bethesdensis]APH62217.1 Transporter, MFS superfamily [Granulibacter bethesdensis]
MVVRNNLVSQATVILVASIFGLGYSLSAALIALRLEATGANDLTIGLNAAMHAAGVLGIAMFLPRLSARFGMRFLLLLSLLATTIILILFPLMPWSWTWFPLRLGLGVATEILFVLSETWANQLCDDASRGKVMAFYMTAMSGGFAAGPLLLSATGTGGFAPWLAGGTLSLLAALVLLLGTTTPPPAQHNGHGGFLHYLRLAPVALFSTALNAGVEAAGMSFLPLYAMSAGWGENGATQLLSTLMLGAIMLQLPIGWLADRMPREKLILHLALIAGIGALAWPWLISLGAIAYIALFVWGGVFVGIYTVTLTMIGSRFSGSDLVGLYAAAGLAWGVGALLGPSAVGAANILTAHGLPVVTAAGCLIFALFIRRYVYRSDS